MYKFLVFLLLTGCNVAAPKVPLCVEISQKKAYCVNTITSEEFYWDDTHKYKGETYWEGRPKLLLMPASSWADIKIFIIQICKQTKKCDTQVANWERTVGTIDQKVNEKR